MTDTPTPTITGDIAAQGGRRESLPGVNGFASYPGATAHYAYLSTVMLAEILEILRGLTAPERTDV